MWQRADLSPSKVQKNYSLGYVIGGHSLGGDFNFKQTLATAQHTWRMPNLKHILSASATYNDYDGETFSHDPARFQILSGRLAYRLRVGDDLSTRIWPLFYFGRSSLELAWQHDEFLSGSFAQPTGDFISLESLNSGYITRFGPFTATGGVQWAPDTGQTNFFFRLNVQALTVPLRQDQAEQLPSAYQPPSPDNLLYLGGTP
jgi:hypothetical protein